MIGPRHLKGRTIRPDSGLPVPASATGRARFSWLDPSVDPCARPLRRPAHPAAAPALTAVADLALPHRIVGLRFYRVTGIGDRAAWKSTDLTAAPGCCAECLTVIVALDCGIRNLFLLSKSQLNHAGIPTGSPPAPGPVLQRPLPVARTGVGPHGPHRHGLNSVSQFALPSVPAPVSCSTRLSVPSLKTGKADMPVGQAVGVLHLLAIICAISVHPGSLIKYSTV